MKCGKTAADLPWMSFCSLRLFRCRFFYFLIIQIVSCYIFVGPSCYVSYDEYLNILYDLNRWPTFKSISFPPPLKLHSKWIWCVLWCVLIGIHGSFLLFLFPACQGNRYGPGCRQICHCKNGASCDHVTGACRCTAGWRGPACQEGKLWILTWAWFSEMEEVADQCQNCTASVGAHVTECISIYIPSN